MTQELMCVRGLRLPVRAQATLVVAGRRVTARTANLSLGGVFIELEEPFPVGTQIELSIDLEGGWVKGLCEVVWTRSMSSVLGPAGVGCEFRELLGGRGVLRAALGE